MCRSCRLCTCVRPPAGRSELGAPSFWQGGCHRPYSFYHEILSFTLGALVPGVPTCHPLGSGGSSIPAALQNLDWYLDHCPPMTTGQFWRVSLIILDVSICGEFSPGGLEVLMIWPLPATPSLALHPSHCT